ncbi:MAG: hypothetical protein H6604_01810 [Flavobacteriales bacterium]|nr:hypothetical protein [Flavobacteriales bacterium]
MLEVYFWNYTDDIGVSVYKPLEASLEQALDIFTNLPERDGSYIGIVSEQGIKMQITKYNKFLWVLEIPVAEKKGKYQIFLTRNKVISLVKDLFDGFNPMKINGLDFEKYNNTEE